MKDAYYFSHDANARNDPKICAMRAVYGYEGYGWYWAIIEMLREQAEFKLPYSKAWAWLNLSSSLATTKDTIKQFVDDCINEYELLTSDGDYFWSDSLNRRMERREEQREKLRQAGRKGGRSSAKARLKPGLSKATASVQQGSSKERKGKESKEKEIESTPQEQAILAEFASVKNYPLDESKDLEAIRALASDYPAFDLLAEAKAWRAYKLDVPLVDNSRPRSQFRKWVSNVTPKPRAASQRNPWDGKRVPE